ncbi:MAG: hypothetical protein ACI32N_10085 [Bulleidia sp.]
MDTLTEKEGSVAMPAYVHDEDEVYVDSISDPAGSARDILIIVRE